MPVDVRKTNTPIVDLSNLVDMLKKARAGNNNRESFLMRAESNRARMP